MPLRKRIGKKLYKETAEKITGGRRVADRLSRPPISGALIGGSVVAGVGAGIFDEEGPYPRVQEQAFGSRNAIQYSLKSAVVSGMTPGITSTGVEDYYYGRPNRISSRQSPVPGEVVFGMYNTRRS